MCMAGKMGLSLLNLFQKTLLLGRVVVVVVVVVAEGPKKDLKSIIRICRNFYVFRLAYSAFEP